MLALANDCRSVLPSQIDDYNAAVSHLQEAKKNYKAYILQILFQINTEAFMWLIICTITSAAATKPMLTGFADHAARANHCQA